MEILQTRRFKKIYKKLHQNQLGSDLWSAINSALQAIIDNPEIGEQKKGDLSWLRVHKFKMVNQLTLIGYSIETERRLTFVDIGSHENFTGISKEKKEHNHGLIISHIPTTAISPSHS